MNFDSANLASVMLAINVLGVKHPELPALRKRAVAIQRRERRLQKAGSVAVVFWAAIKRGISAEALLEVDEAKIVKLALAFEGKTQEQSTTAEKRQKRRARKRRARKAKD